MDEFIDDDNLGDRILRKGQVDPFAPKRHRSEGATTEFPARERVRPSLMDKKDVEKKGDVKDEDVEQFHTDVLNMVSTVLDEDLPRFMRQRPYTETFERNDEAAGKFGAKVVWREELRNLPEDQRDYLGNFSYREVEIQRLSKESPEGALYSFVVRYIREDGEDSGNKYGNEYILTLDTHDVTQVRGASVWEFKHDDEAHESKNLYLNKDGEVVDTREKHLPAKIAGRTDVLNGKPVAVVDTFKQWVQMMPGMKLK